MPNVSDSISPCSIKVIDTYTYLFTFYNRCNTGQAKYTCPRCSLPYCSVDCYKSTSHLDCSEGFYKECVESEMKNAIDPEDKNKMMQILKRVHEQGINQFDPLDDNIEDYAEDDCSIDSDDDDDVKKILNLS